jgi:hypothetical protein
MTKKDKCSEIWSHADWYMDRDVSGDLSVSVFRAVQCSGIRYIPKA